MIIVFLILLIVFSVALDWYIVSQHIKNSPKLKLCYIVTSATITALVLSVALLFKPLLNNGSDHGTALYAMWAITLFFMSLGSRMAFVLTTLPGFTSKRHARL